ncbi:major facilitator superfamily domain-containing protein [Aspergillus spectabilis]
MAFFSLVIPATMVSLDGTSVSVALPLPAYLRHLPAALAALSHIFGRMPVLTFCVVFFLIGIIISGVASSFTPMLIGRALQGVGGGGIILMSDVIITDLVPMRLRGKYFGIIGAVWALGSITRPVIGGALAHHLPKLRRVDWLGTALFIAATTAFLIPVSWGGVQYPWSSLRTLAPLIFGVVSFAAFLIYEKYIPSEPTFRLHLLKSYNMAYSLYATFINAMIVYGTIYFLPLYFEATKEYNPIITGVAFFPATLTVAPASIISGLIITKTGDFKCITVTGWIISTLGLGIMILLDTETTIPQWIFLTLTPGLGLGMLYTSLAFINQSASNDSSMAFAVSLFIFARLLGQCIGVAICGVIFQNRMRVNLISIPSLADHAVEYSRDASNLVTQLGGIEDSVRRGLLVKAYAEALRVAWGALCAFSGTAMMGGFFVRRVSLDRALNTEQGLREEGGEA